jgi:hypothetical protein
MPIVPSRAGEIKELIVALGDGRAARRDAALAKLTLIGARCVPQAIAALKSRTAAVRVGALATLERVASPRVVPEIAPVLADADDSVAARAAQALAVLGGAPAAKALRRVLRSPRLAVALAAAEGLIRLQDHGVGEALEPLLGILFDEDAQDDVRLVAFASLARLPRSERAPLLKRLSGTRSIRLARAAGGQPLPKGVAAIPNLHHEIERLREASDHSMTPSARDESRAHLHLALARLDSRIALYDLREMLEARPLRSAGELLEAAQLIGDKSLVPPLARLASEEPGLVDLCIAAFGAIVRRESLGRKSAVTRGVRPEHRAAFDRLWTASRERLPSA